MNYHTFRKLFFVPSLLAILALESCQKDVDPGDPVPPIPDEVKDSTLLIKQISYAYYLGTPSEDSVVETYTYDTVNRRININWSDPTGDYIADGTNGEFNYNEKGLLSRVVYKYPAGYSPQAYDYKTIEITYDAESILHKIVVENGIGETDSRTFIKTKSPSGQYSLTWTEPTTDNDSTIREVIFEQDGKVFGNYTETYYRPSPADIFFYGQYIIDSLAYSPDGSVSKVTRYAADASQNSSEEFTLYEFTRHSKGDQLYNQRQVLMNGIANIPFGDYDGIIEEAFGILSFNLTYETLLFSKYPVSTVSARMYDGSTKNFTSSSIFDSKNRVIKFTGFLHDYDLDPREYRVSYYK